MKKKLITLILSPVIAIGLGLMTLPTNVYAATLPTVSTMSTNTNAKSLNVTISNKITEKTISKNEVPKGMKLKSFKNEQQAINSFNQLKQKIISNSENSNKVINSKLMYKGSAYKQEIISIGLDLYMNVPYTVQWSSSEGNYYSYSGQPSSGLTGLTFDVSWTPDNGGSYSYISNNGLTLNAYATGEVNDYLICDGVYKLFSSPASISGTWGQP